MRQASTSRSYDRSAASLEARAQALGFTTPRLGKTSMSKHTSFQDSGAHPIGSMVADFTSDVGRKLFGFSHEEVDSSTAYYEGQFKMNMRQGVGCFHAPESGVKYEGEFQADKYHGAGESTWCDGSRYKGQWWHGQKHGKGEYTSADELKYVGKWENGLRHGLGKQEYANNDRYEGGWFKGLCSGHGVYYFADGSRYEGTWSQGRYEGSGIMVNANGTCERHRYSCGLLTKREVLPNALAGGTLGAQMTCKPVVTQSREEMHKSTARERPQMSRYLINRETEGMDLSAPPLRALPALTGSDAPRSLLDLSAPPLRALPALTGSDAPRSLQDRPAPASRAAAPALAGAGSMVVGSEDRLQSARGSPTSAKERSAKSAPSAVEDRTLRPSSGASAKVGGEGTEPSMMETEPSLELPANYALSHVPDPSPSHSDASVLVTEPSRFQADADPRVIVDQATGDVRIEMSRPYSTPSPLL